MQQVILRRTFLLFAVVFLYFNFSCESESALKIAADNEASSNNFEDSIIENSNLILEFKKAAIKDIPDIESFIGRNIRSQGTSKKDNGNNIILDTTNILAITDSLKTTNYTLSFMVHKEEYSVPAIHNLIFGVDSLGRTSNPIVIRYRSKEGYEEEWVNHDFNLAYFTGEISLHKYTDFFNEDLSLTAADDPQTYCLPEFDEYGDPIACIIDNVDSSGSGGGGGTGSVALAPTGGSTGGSGGCTYTMYWNYCGGTNQSSSHSATICGGNGTGAGWILHVVCPNYTSTTQFYKNGSLTGKDSDCISCSSGPSGVTATNTYASSVLKLESHFYNHLDYQLKFSELTWLNINDDYAYKLNQFLLTDGFNLHNIEFVKWALEIEMAAEVLQPCGINNDCVASILSMAAGLRKFHGQEGAIMADYFESLINDYDSFTIDDLQAFYDTAKAVTQEYNNKMFDNIVQGFADGVKPIVEIALFEVGGTVALKLLSKLPSLVKTAQIIEVINNLKKATSSLSVFKYAERFGIKTYAQHVSFFNSMNISRSQLGVQVHHLIEKRFAPIFGVNTNSMKSIVLTAEEHNTFTQAWRAKIGYVGDSAKITTETATKAQVESAAREIYREYPEILTALGL